MRARLAWLGGGLGVAGLFLYRQLRRAPVPVPPLAPVEANAHAEELRRKLDEARSREREPTPAGDLTEDLEERRRRVHEAGRAAIEDMRGPTPAD